MLNQGDKPIGNPLAVLREEFDDWAVLFDPDTGNACGLNPVGVFIWKLLDGRHTVQDMLEELQESYADVSVEAANHVKAFIRDLVNRGLAGYEIEGRG